ncbi:hypothetical protein LV779_04125 [Streptomyces thinghirensis]|nr:hypothetical protein [Streptomyces thinghirensis]
MGAGHGRHRLRAVACRRLLGRNADHAARRRGGRLEEPGRPPWRRAHVPSSTLPSLVLRMWSDADVTEGHTVLEIGTGTGYSTALARAAGVVPRDQRRGRFRQARGGGRCPLRLRVHADTARADGLYGYWPEAWFDRIVAACSFRSVPPALLSQTRPGGKVLLPLSGWLYGSARVLLTVAGDGTAEGPCCPAPSPSCPPGPMRHRRTGIPRTGRRTARETPVRAARPRAPHGRDRGGFPPAVPGPRVPYRTLKWSPSTGYCT